MLWWERHSRPDGTPPLRDESKCLVAASGSIRPSRSTGRGPLIALCGLAAALRHGPPEKVVAVTKLTSATTSPYLSPKAQPRRAAFRSAVAGVAVVGLTVGLATIPATAIAAPTADRVAPAAVAPSPDAGLFGAQDPSYDGVFRQGLAVLALDAAGARVPRQAVAWLRGQQCADGSFMAYRPNRAVPCSKPDNSSYSGSDTNSTALAVAALNAVDQRPAANRGAAWLRARQNLDGGWAYYPSAGAASDANSTGLVMLALRASGLQPAAVRSRANRSGVHTLVSLQAGCTTPKGQRGGVAYQAGGGADDLATAQAALGLLGLVRRQGAGAAVVPVARPFTARAAGGNCVGNNRQPTALAVNYLADKLQANKGLLPDPWDPTAASIGNTAYATLAVAASGSSTWVVRASLVRLAKVAGGYLRSTVNGKPTDDAGRLALLALTARQGGGNPSAFGGVNLVNRLQQTRRT